MPANPRLCPRVFLLAEVVAMILLKGCPKCRGDLIFDPLEDTERLSCLQCGRYVPVVVSANAGPESKDASESHRRIAVETGNGRGQLIERNYSFRTRIAV